MKKYFIDLDNTLCFTKLSDYNNSTPILERIEYVNKLYDEGNEITYWTARGSYSGIDYYNITKFQLDSWGCKYHFLSVGEKPTYDLLICDKTKRIEEI